MVLLQVLTTASTFITASYIYILVNTAEDPSVRVKNIRSGGSGSYSSVQKISHMNLPVLPTLPPQPDMDGPSPSSWASILLRDMFGGFKVA